MTTSARERIARGGVLVIGHRGAAARAPENTLSALDAAREAGADLVELDVHTSRDGVPVVVHDETLERTTDAPARWPGGDLRVAARSAGELATLDAGGWAGAAFADARLPTLEQALERLAPWACAALDVKRCEAGTLCALLARRGWLERVVVMAFDVDLLAACHALRPELVLGALGPGPLAAGRWEAAAAAGVSLLAWDQRHVDAGLVRAAHERGWKLWAWTVDEARRVRALRALGVDGLVGDDPAHLRALLGNAR